MAHVLICNKSPTVLLYVCTFYRSSNSQLGKREMAQLVNIRRLLARVLLDKSPLEGG